MINRASPQTIHQAETVASAHPPHRLPAEWPAWVGGQWGGGGPCVVCTDAIEPTQAEVQAMFRNDDSRTFHARCFVDWWQAVAATGAA